MPVSAADSSETHHILNKDGDASMHGSRGAAA
jgi:hypothetical protein